jgi:hypothetical protein
VGIAWSGTGFQEPVLIVEPRKGPARPDDELLREIRALAQTSHLTKDIRFFLSHPAFPVDIRHNAKIFREKLAFWAEGKVQR